MVKGWGRRACSPTEAPRGRTGLDWAHEPCLLLLCACGQDSRRNRTRCFPRKNYNQRIYLMKRPSRVVQPEDVVQHEVVAWRRGHELENLRKLERVLLSLHLRESGTSRAREKKSRQTGKAALEKNEGKIGSARETTGRNRERETDFGASLISLSVRVR